jgi:predicted ATPase with chaperone activity
MRLTGHDKAAICQLQGMSGANHPALKLSRTMADLARKEAITHARQVEAPQYRPKLDLVKGVNFVIFSTTMSNRNILDN